MAARYLVPRVQARSGAARHHRAHLERGAEDRVVVQQPAVAGGDHLGRGDHEVSRRDLSGRRQRRADDGRFRIPARVSRRLSRPPPRERLPALQHARHRHAATRPPHAKQALENFNFFGAPHVAIITTDEALGVYGAVDCGGYVTSFMLAAQALGVATVPQAALAFHAGRSCASISASATTAAWSAASRSATPTASTRPTAIAPTAPRSARWRRSWMS